MTFSKTVFEELKACKSSINTLQKGLEQAQVNYEVAVDLEDAKEIKLQESIIDYADKKINAIISSQAKSMKIEFNDAVYLIYNLEDAKRFIA